MFLYALIAIQFSFVFVKGENNWDVYFQPSKLAAERTCQEKGTEEFVELIQRGYNEFEECSSRILDVDMLIREMMRAKLNDSVAETAKRQCAKSSEAKTCINTLIEALAMCMDAVDKEIVDSMSIAFGRALDFMCNQNGRMLTAFIEGDGLTCIANKSEELQSCIEKFYVQTDFLVGFDQATVCFVSKMGTCRFLPAAILNRVFTYARQGIRNSVLTK